MPPRRSLPVADRLTMMPLFQAMLDFDSSPETYERYDRMSALELFKQYGVSKRRAPARRALVLPNFASTLSCVPCCCHLSLSEPYVLSSEVLYWIIGASATGPAVAAQFTGRFVARRSETLRHTADMTAIELTIAASQIVHEQHTVPCPSIPCNDP